MEESMNCQSKSTTPIRADKTIAWLIESRDQWKQKCLRAKIQLKQKTLALKRVREGRSQLKNLLRSEKERNRELGLMVQTQQSQLSELKKSTHQRR